MSRLLDYYYFIERHEHTDAGELYIVSLNPDCDIYLGHFPDNPIAPGVCNIQMIKELSEIILNKKLSIRYISKCRFLNVINPLEISKINVIIQINETNDIYEIKSLITGYVTDTMIKYVEFKGEMINRGTQEDGKI